MNHQSHINCAEWPFVSRRPKSTIRVVSYLTDPHPRVRPQVKVRWWRPPPRELLRHLGWGWLLFVPPGLGVLVLLVLGLGGPRLGAYWWIAFRIFAVIAPVPLLFIDYFRFKAIRARPDPFCVHCGYTLTGLPEEGNCPECGRPFRMKVVEMFRRDPQWVIAYWRSAGKPPTVELFEAAHRRR